MRFGRPRTFGVLLVAYLAAVETRGHGLAVQDVLSRPAAVTRARELAALGQALFRDASLSASGRLSCASCHDPAHAFAAPGRGPVAFGGPNLNRPGHRAVPSLMYLQTAPPFAEHFFDEEGDESVDAGPTGGLTWDGRVDRVRDQARIPLFAANEMANGSASELMRRVARSPEAPAFVDLFGSSTVTDSDGGVVAVALALEVYQEDSGAFYPYSSKFDAYLAARVPLSLAESRGLRLFEDPATGNCAHCHSSRPDRNGSPPQLTDYGFAALGLPRNARLAVNANPAYVDLGLCGPDRSDLVGRADYCGRFMTPSLRNVATRHVFFHNGVVDTLRRAVEFYAERDVRPERWYPRAPDGVRKFDDLPSAYWPNVDADRPFGGHPGDPPRLTAGDIDDLVAFLRTLTDGFQAPVPTLLDQPGASR